MKLMEKSKLQYMDICPFYLTPRGALTHARLSNTLPSKSKKVKYSHLKGLKGLYLTHSDLLLSTLTTYLATL